MNQRAKELWLIPTIIALATGIPLGACFMFLGQWLAGTPIHPSFSLGWVKLGLFASLPVWVTLVVLLVTVVFAGLFLRPRARTAEETEKRNSAIQAVGRLKSQITKLNQEHAAQIERLNAKEPRLHGVWNNSQTFWHLGRKGQEPMMQIGGWIDLTSSNTEEVIYLQTCRRILGEKNDMTRCLLPAGNTTTRALAQEAPCLRSHAHRQPRQQHHESRAGQLSMTHSLHRFITTESSCPAWGHYRWCVIQRALMG